jgi:two-component system response regulator RegA
MPEMDIDVARERDRGGRPLLLLVDEDENYAAALSRSLALRGFAIRVARSVGEAIGAASSRPPQYAVVDLKLPDGSGLKLVSGLRALDPRTRVVVLTGHGSIPSAVEAIKLGATYYLTKPTTADDLIAALGRDAGDDSVPVNGKPMSIGRVEWEHIHRVLHENRGNISATARALSMHRRTLQRKLAKRPVRS